MNLHGQRHKLDADKARAIRERDAAGEHREDLALEFRVSPACISMVCTGVLWPHAGGPIREKRNSGRPAGNSRELVRTALAQLGEATSHDVAMQSGLSVDTARQVLSDMKRCGGQVETIGRNPFRWRLTPEGSAVKPIERRRLKLVHDAAWGLVRGRNELRRDDCSRLGACLTAWCASHRDGSAQCPDGCAGYDPVERNVRLEEAIDGRGCSNVVARR